MGDPPSSVLSPAARWTALALSSGVGISSTIGAAINSKLGQSLGSGFYGATACYVIGLLIIWTATNLHARRNGIPVLRFAKDRPQWFELCGGCCGATFMLIAMVCVQKLGVELFFSLIVVGQLSSATLQDHVGFLGLPVSPASRAKLVALAVALLGVFVSASAPDSENQLPANDMLQNQLDEHSRTFYCVLAMCGGLVQPLQSVLNWRLSKLLPHKLQAVTVSFTVAGCIVTCVGLLSFSTGALTGAQIWEAALIKTRWWMWCGALCIMAVLTGGVYLPAKITTSLYYMFLLVGELVASLLFDHIGAFGLPVRPASGPRLLGLMLVCAGAVLMQAPPDALSSIARRIHNSALFVETYSFLQRSGILKAVGSVLAYAARASSRYSLAPSAESPEGDCESSPQVDADADDDAAGIGLGDKGGRHMPYMSLTTPSPDGLSSADGISSSDSITPDSPRALVAGAAGVLMSPGGKPLDSDGSLHDGASRGFGTPISAEAIIAAQSSAPRLRHHPSSAIATAAGATSGGHALDAEGDAGVISPGNGGSRGGSRVSSPARESSDSWPAGVTSSSSSAARSFTGRKASTETEQALGMSLLRLFSPSRQAPVVPQR